MSREELDKFEKEILGDIDKKLKSKELITVSITGNTVGGEKMGKIGEARDANAAKVIALLKELGIEEKEYTKVLSRAYRLAAKKE